MNPNDPNQQNPYWNQQNPYQQGYNPQQPPFQQGYNPQQAPFQPGVHPHQPYQPYIPPYNPAFHGQMDLPNAGLALGLSIAGLMVFLHLIALICAIVALVMASNAISEYERNPGRYTEFSYNRVKSARTMGIIGISLVGLVIVIAIIAAALD